jgi:uncharacterized protein
MTGARQHLLRVGALLGFVVSLAACWGSDPARVFTLVSRPGPQQERVTGAIAVRPVDFPKYLDRPQLVRRTDPYELRMSEYERWGEGVSDMITRVLVNNLAMRLPRSQVFASSSGLTAAGDRTLEVSISRFEAEPAGAVVLAAQWQFLGDDRRKARLQSADIRVEGNPEGPTSLVATMSDALGQLSDRIAASAVR